MMSLDVKVDVKQALKVMANVKKQIAFANVQALNHVAFNIQRAEKAALPSLFAHPRPFTLTSVAAPIKATKASPTATIFIKPKSAVYLKPYEDGGEHYLHTIPARPDLGRVRVVPVRIKTDAFGQITPTQLISTLSRPDVFIGTIHTVLGIWQRSATRPGTRRDGTYGTKGRLNTLDNGRMTTLILLARIEPNVPVHKHLDFVKRGKALFLKDYPAAFEKAFARAMATARD